MTGKTVLITGATAGIGKATALDLARRRARVVLACRNVSKAEKVAAEIRRETGNSDVHVKCLDLCSFDSVRKCAEDVLKTEKRLDVLINNAGIQGTAKRQITEDNCEEIMQANHLGHFLFTLLLLDLLKRSAPSRIVVVASAAKNFAKLDINDLTNSKMQSYVTVYSNSKLANILFTVELAKRLSGTGVTVNACHPGCVKSDIFDKSDIKYDLFALFSKALFFFVGKTSEGGAQTSIYLAVQPELKNTTGKYFVDCKESKLKKSEMDPTLTKSLFEISEQIVGVSFTGKSKTI